MTFAQIFDKAVTGACVDLSRMEASPWERVAHLWLGPRTVYHMQRIGNGLYIWRNTV